MPLDDAGKRAGGATTDELTAFLVDAVEAAIGPVRTRPMFGGVGVWCDGTFFAMVWDGALLLRFPEADEDELIRHGFEPNDPSSAGKRRKRYYRVPADVLDRRDALERWVRYSADSARRPGAG